MAINIYDILRSQHRGRLLETFEQDLSDCLAAVRESGKEGEVTLKLKIKPADREALQVNIYASHSAKLPRVQKPPVMFFVTGDGGLSSRDPRQPALPGEMHVLGGGEEETDRKSAAAGER